MKKDGGKEGDKERGGSTLVKDGRRRSNKCVAGVWRKKVRRL